MEGFLYLLPFIVAAWFGTSFFFKAAGYASWKAYIPVYNVYIWLKIIQKPTWWVLLSFIPVVNLVLYVGMVVELLNSFGMRNKLLHAITASFSFVMLPYLGLKGNLNYTGPVDYTTEKKGEAREWAEAMFFAIIAATAIRAFVLEAFVIPTGSMERSLRVYDCLFVNKMSYGTRFTMTPLSIPFTHQTIPGTLVKSYTDFVKIPYFRFPALEDVDNGDMVVFNYPKELYHPVDKRTHYIKRCMGIPGDSLSIVNQQIMINGKPVDNPKNYQFSHTVISKGQINDRFLEEYEISPEDRATKPAHNGYFQYDFAMPDSIAEKLGKESFIQSVTKNVINPIDSTYGLFPNDKVGQWSPDFYGPIFLPEPGATITLSDENYGTYNDIIRNHEHQQIFSAEEIVEKMKQLMRIQKLVNRNNFEETFFMYAAKNLQAFIGEFMTPMLDGFMFAEVSDDMRKLGDQFYWKDNADYSKEDILKLGTEYKSFVELHAQNEIDQYKSLLKELAPEIFVGDKISMAQLDKTNSKYLINGEVTNQYTFKKGYYFMIGDNRHRSADSRFWGFVPEDHIVGKPVFVWMSIDNTVDGLSMDKFRWNRMFTFVSSDGLSKSYLIHFLFLAAGWTAFNRLYWKKRKKNKA